MRECASTPASACYVQAAELNQARWGTIGGTSAVGERDLVLRVQSHDNAFKRAQLDRLVDPLALTIEIRGKCELTVC